MSAWYKKNLEKILEIYYFCEVIRCVLLKYVLKWTRIKVRYLWTTVRQAALFLHFDVRYWKYPRLQINKMQRQKIVWHSQRTCDKAQCKDYLSQEVKRHENYNERENIKSIISARCSECTGVAVIIHAARQIESCTVLNGLIKGIRINAGGDQPYGPAEKQVRGGGGSLHGYCYNSNAETQSALASYNGKIERAHYWKITFEHINDLDYSVSKFFIPCWTTTWGRDPKAALATKGWSDSEARTMWTRSGRRGRKGGWNQRRRCNEGKTSKQKMATKKMSARCQHDDKFEREFCIKNVWHDIANNKCVYHDKSYAQTGGQAIGPPIRSTFGHVMPLFNCQIKSIAKILTKVRLRLHIYSDKRHKVTCCKLLLRFDIESNPGPGAKATMQIMTVNCRGLNKINKFRLLLNRAYDVMSQGPAVILLQETMVVNSNYLDVAWRGKYVHTPGLGNSQGCITLLSNGVTVTDVIHVKNRAHLFKVTGLLPTETMVANLYAPIGYDELKLNFFKGVFEKILYYTGDNVIVGGDFNFTFTAEERVGQTVSGSEGRHAAAVLDHIETCGLTDTWEGQVGYTWRRGATLSRLDRVLVRLPSYRVKTVRTNWTIVKSDHAAVTVELEHQVSVKQCNEHVKLCNSIVTHPQSLAELREYVQEQMVTAVNMDPHMKLEFLKMSIRTKALQLMATKCKQQAQRLTELEADINANTALLANHTDADSQDILQTNLERDKL
jgi:hypothetical protein